jgi:hypothetical protein
MLKDITLTCPLCRHEPKLLNSWSSPVLFVSCSNKHCALSDYPIITRQWNNRKREWIPVNSGNVPNDIDLMVKDKYGDVALFYYNKEKWDDWCIEYYMPAEYR